MEEYDEDDNEYGYDYELENQQKLAREAKEKAEKAALEAAKKARKKARRRPPPPPMSSVRPPKFYSSGFLSSWSSKNDRPSPKPVYYKTYVTVPTKSSGDFSPPETFHPFSGFYHKNKFNQ